MAYTIEWTRDALGDMQNIIEYLTENWSYKIGEEFQQTVLTRLERLSEQPSIGVASTSGNNIRFIIVTKQNKLYYQVAGNTIFVLNVFDTRQHPSKNKFETGR